MGEALAPFDIKKGPSYTKRWGSPPQKPEQRNDRQEGLLICVFEYRTVDFDKISEKVWLFFGNPYHRKQCGYCGMIWLFSELFKNMKTAAARPSGKKEKYDYEQSWTD